MLFAYEPGKACEVVQHDRRCRHCRRSRRRSSWDVGDSPRGEFLVESGDALVQMVMKLIEAKYRLRG